jgi:ABC-type antimicrobial peptide transport system permease subunit
LGFKKTKTAPVLLFSCSPARFLLIFDGDPLAFVAAFATLFATCAAAGWVPARRAARTEPMIVLRES